MVMGWEGFNLLPVSLHLVMRFHVSNINAWDIRTHFGFDVKKKKKHFENCVAQLSPLKTQTFTEQTFFKLDLNLLSKLTLLRRLDTLSPKLP